MTTSTHILRYPKILSTSYMGKINTLGKEYESCIKYFLEYILKLDVLELILNFSDLYVLVAEWTNNDNVEDLSSWKNILNIVEYQRLEENKYMIIGFLMIKKTSNYKYMIEYSEDIIKNKNIKQLMINRLSSLYDISILNFYNV